MLKLKDLNSFFESNYFKLETAFTSDSIFSSTRAKLTSSLFLSLFFSLSISYLGTFSYESILKHVSAFFQIAAIVFIASFISFQIFSLIEKLNNFNSRFFKYFVLIIIDIIVISISIYSYNHFSPEMSPIYNYFKILQETFIVMLLPSLIFVLSYENYMIRERLKIISVIKNTEVEVKEQVLIIKSDNIKESLKINANDFIYAESSDNYSSIFYKNNDKVSKVLFRLTLKKLEDQFKEFEITIRCHKSYLVNINHIKEIIGTSQNYRISLQDVEIQIPVSRNFPKAIIESLKERDLNN